MLISFLKYRKLIKPLKTTNFSLKNYLSYRVLNDEQNKPSIKLDHVWVVKFNLFSYIRYYVWRKTNVC